MLDFIGRILSVNPFLPRGVFRGRFDFSHISPPIMVQLTYFLVRK
jgi:hypothetical protein